MNAQPPEDARAAGGSAFPTTQWSVVLHAGANSSSQAQAALESLCRQYWYPLYAFVRRQGRAHHEAEDCTQDFFAQLLAADGLQRARPERGRFRTFLLTGLRNFLTSEWRRATAAKRGGGLAPVPLVPLDADAQFCHEPADTGLTPEQAFDRSWALGIIDRAVRELRAEYQRSGREKIFDALAPLVWGHASPIAPELEAARLGMSLQAFNVALHRVRRRLGERLRTTVAETVAEAGDIDAELRHLVAAVSGQASPTS